MVCSLLRSSDRVRLSIRCLVLFNFVFLPTFALADDSAECAKFRGDLEGRFGKNAKIESLAGGEALDLMDLCLGQYAKCNDPMCVQWMQSKSAATSQPQADARPAAPIQVNPSVETAAPLIEQNPLAWLERDMSCSEFKDQFRGRYQALGSYSNLPADKKAEINQVLGVACSPRFASCGLSSCPKVVAKADGFVDIPPAETSNAHQAAILAATEEIGDRPVQVAAATEIPAPPAVQVAAAMPVAPAMVEKAAEYTAPAPRVPTELEVRAAAAKELADLVSNHQHKQQLANEATLKKERSGGIDWQRVAMVDEVRARAHKAPAVRQSALGVPAQSFPTAYRSQDGAQISGSDTDGDLNEPDPAQEATSKRRARQQRIADPNADDERQGVVPSSGGLHLPPPVRAF